MPLLFERLLEKIYNIMITKEKMVPGRGLEPWRLIPSESNSYRGGTFRVTRRLTQPSSVLA
jgi:hypothetical protein